MSSKNFLPPKKTYLLAGLKCHIINSAKYSYCKQNQLFKIILTDKIELKRKKLLYYPTRLFQIWENNERPEPLTANSTGTEKSTKSYMQPQKDWMRKFTYRCLLIQIFLQMMHNIIVAVLHTIFLQKILKQPNARIFQTRKQLITKHLLSEQGKSTKPSYQRE